MYFHMEEAAQACLESGIRASLSRGLAGFDAAAGAASLEEGKDFVRNWHGAGEGRITAMLGPHAPYTCPPEYLQKVAEAADLLQTPLHIHLAETRAEVEESVKTYGQRPIELMEKIGLLERRVLAAHCVHLTKGEIEILADRKVSVAHNPGSNLKLGSGVAPLADLMRAGVLVALGTDSAASNNNLDMMEEMRLASLLSKGIFEDPTSIPAAAALNLATVNGAKALFLEEECGTLKAGARADLIMVNLNAPHLCPLHSIPAHMVYSAFSGDVEMVMVDGRVLLENGELKTVDEEKVLFQAGRAAARLVGASNNT
jgi:5-methylthioadenosine/S-adenosylhomocysteine deaminase